MEIKKIMSLVGALTMASSIVTPSAYANCVKNVSGACVAAGAAGTTAVGSTVYAIKKFSQADSVENVNTVTLYDLNSNPRELNPSLVGNMVSRVQDGDRATVGYELSEPESRQYHINSLTDQINSNDSYASSERLQAQTALLPRTETEYYTDEHGQQRSRSVIKGPDFVANAYHNSLADDYERKASQLRDQRAEIKNGAKITLVRLEEQIDTRSTSLAQWLSKESNRGSKLVSLKKLPATFARQMTKLRVKGGLGVAGAVAGAATAGTLIYLDISSSQQTSGSSGDYHASDYQRPRNGSQ